jgi:hypothetical protein
MNTERVSINLSKAKTLYHNRYQKKLKEHIYLSRATWSNAGSSALFVTSAFALLAAVIEFLAHLAPCPRVMIYLMSMAVLINNPVVRGTGIAVYCKSTQYI